MDTITRLVLLISFAIVSACGEFIVDDKDFSDNRRSVDITSDNAESLTWTAYMAGVETFRQSELYYGLVPQTFGAQSGVLSCTGGGEIHYSYSKDVADRLVAGDTFDIQYSNCVRASGEVANGRVSGSYSEVEGYNYSFDSTLDVDECIARVRADEAPNAVVIDDEADEVIFILGANSLQILYRDMLNATDQIDVATYSIGLDQQAIVLNRSQTQPSSSREEDGARLYLVLDPKSDAKEAVDCDEARIKGSLVVENLIVSGNEVESTLNSSLSFDYWYRESGNEDFVFESDIASIKILKNSYQENVALEGLEWSWEMDAQTTNAYALSLSSEMTGDAVGGVAEIAVLVPLRGGMAESTPGSGQLRVLGVGLERSTMNIDNTTQIRFSVAPEGDISGNLQPNTAPLFSSSWVDFLERDFLRPELVVTP